MKNMKFFSGMLLMLLYTILIFVIVDSGHHEQKPTEIQEASIVPEWITKKATARGYVIEKKYAYGKTFFVLVDGGGNPIQMIAYE